MSEMLTPDELAKWLRDRAKHSADREQERLIMAADTIERLTKERNQLGAGGKVWQRTAGQLKLESDTALAEVERLKAELRDTRWQIKKEGIRLTEKMEDL